MTRQMLRRMFLRLEEISTEVRRIEDHVLRQEELDAQDDLMEATGMFIQKEPPIEAQIRDNTTRRYQALIAEEASLEKEIEALCNGGAQ